MAMMPTQMDIANFLASRQAAMGGGPAMMTAQAGMNPAMGGIGALYGLPRTAPQMPLAAPAGGMGVPQGVMAPAQVGMSQAGMGAKGPNGAQVPAQQSFQTPLSPMMMTR